MRRRRHPTGDASALPPYLCLVSTALLLAVDVSPARAADRLEDYRGKTILIFSPHPDDDTFAVGGTMALLARHNRVIVILYDQRQQGQLRSRDDLGAARADPQG